MKKRILSMLLVIVMAIGLLPTTVLATGGAPANSTGGEIDNEAAMATVLGEGNYTFDQTTSTITLLNDVTFSGDLKFKRLSTHFTLDLNGHTLDMGANSVIIENSAKTTITNSTGNGKINSSTYAVKMEDYANLHLSGTPDLNGTTADVYCSEYLSYVYHAGYSPANGGPVIIDPAPGAIYSGNTIVKDWDGDSADCSSHYQLKGEEYNSDNPYLAVSGSSLKVADPYGIWVAGVRVTERNKHDILGDGTVSFAMKYFSAGELGSYSGGSRFVLTLENAALAPTSAYSDGYIVFDYSKKSMPDPPALQLIGNNTITTGSSQTATICLKNISDKDLNIVGDGSLSITNNAANGAAFYSNDSAKVRVGNYVTLEASVPSGRVYNGSSSDKDLIYADNTKRLLVEGSSKDTAVEQAGKWVGDNKYIKISERPVVVPKYNFIYKDGATTLESASYEAGTQITLMDLPFENGADRKLLQWKINSDTYNPGDTFTMPADHVNASAVWGYRVTTDQYCKTEKDYYESGETVVIEPADGYKLNVVYKAEGTGNAMYLPAVDGVYSFTMPAGKTVSITAQAEVSRVHNHNCGHSECPDAWPDSTVIDNNKHNSKNPALVAGSTSYFVLGDNMSSSGFNPTLTSGTATVYLCLNGQTIRDITIPKGVTMYICDCSDGKSGKVSFYVNVDGTLKVGDGTYSWLKPNNSELDIHVYGTMKLLENFNNGSTSAVVMENADARFEFLGKPYQFQVIPYGAGVFATGWKSSYGANRMPVSANGAYEVVFDSTTGQLSFVAKVVPYTVTYDANGGTGTVPTQDATAQGGTFTIPDADGLTKDGYTFSGWNDGEKTYAAGDTYTMPAKNVTFTAQWTANTYDVTFDVNGGTINSGNVTSYTYGTGATLPTDVTKTGYAFVGWYDNSSFSGSAVTSIGATATGEKSYYAKWRVNSYNVTANANPAEGGTVTGGGEVEKNSSVTLTATANEGYKFVNWTKGGVEVSTNERYTFTATEDAEYVANFVEAHEHKLCQTDNCTLDHNGDADGVGHDAVHFVPVSTQAELQYYATNGGSVYLKNSIELAGTINVTGNLTLCLNGHTLENTAANKRVIDITGGTLNLTDCGSTGTITGGSFTNEHMSETDATGSGVRVKGAGTFHMYGGTITGNSSVYSGTVAVGYRGTSGVSTTGAFHMYGGTISNNQSKNGGGIFVREGTFTMHGGTISGNTANGIGGGGVYVQYTDTFTMHGGTISGNTANGNGGGVYISNGKFTMTGGRIAGNTAKGNGSSVYGSLKISGSPKISGDVYLGSSGKITITGALNLPEGYKTIQVYSSKNEQHVPITVGASEYGVITDGEQSIFVPKDTENTKIHVHNGEVCQKGKPTVTFDANGGSPTPATQTLPFEGGKATAPAEDPARNRYVFSHWCDNESCTDYTNCSGWNFDTVITESKTIYAIWEPITVTITSEPGKLTAVTSHVATAYQWSTLGDADYPLNAEEIRIGTGYWAPTLLVDGHLDNGNWLPDDEYDDVYGESRFNIFYFNIYPDSWNNNSSIPAGVLTVTLNDALPDGCVLKLMPYEGETVIEPISVSGNTYKWATGEDGDYILAANAPDGMTMPSVTAVFTVPNGALNPIDGETNAIFTNGENGKEYKVTATFEGGSKITSASEVFEELAASYTVTYKAEGQVIGTVTVEHGEDATAPEIPAKEGYNAAWDKDGKNITADTVINAVYTINKYTVTYKADGKVVKTVEVEHGKDATAPEIPAKEGYNETAPKWDKDGKNITADTTINAVYTKNQPGTFTSITPTTNAGGGKLTDKVHELKEKIPFTQEEALQIEYGADVEVWLEVKDISASVPADDKKEIEKKLGDGNVAMYLDIVMFKQVGENEASRLTQLSDKVQISIKLDDSYINTDKDVTRTYSIIHVHDGKAEVITPAFDAATKTLTFETDRFSTYGVVYTDEKITPPTEETTPPSQETVPPTQETTAPTEATKPASKVPATGDSFQPVFWIACMTLSIIGIAVLLLDAKRRHAR